jgi:hypothetical protein
MGEASISSARCLPIEFRAVVTLDNDFTEIDTILFQVLEEAVGGNFSIGERQFIAIREELSTEGELPDGVLVLWEAQQFHLRPVVRDIVEVLGVHLEPGKGLVSRFDSSQIVSNPVLAFPFASGSIRSYDTCNCIDAPGEVELIFEVSGAEGGRFIPVGEDNAFCLGREFVRTGVGSAAAVNQSGETLCRESAAPFEDGVNRTTKCSGSLPLAMCDGIGD